MYMVENMTNMRVSKHNRDRLAHFGMVGESYDDALGHVLDMAEELVRQKNKVQNPLMAQSLEPIHA